MVERVSVKLQELKNYVWTEAELGEICDGVAVSHHKIQKLGTLRDERSYSNQWPPKYDHFPHLCIVYHMHTYFRHRHTHLSMRLGSLSCRKHRAAARDDCVFAHLMLVYTRDAKIRCCYCTTHHPFTREFHFFPGATKAWVGTTVIAHIFEWTHPLLNEHVQITHTTYTRTFSVIHLKVSKDNLS